MQVLLPDRYRRSIVGVFFGLLLVFGLRLVPDYGLTYDEETQRLNGEVSLLYIFQQLPGPVQQRLLSPQAAALLATKGSHLQLSTYYNHDHGVVFELPAAVLEQLLHLHDSRQRFLLRHYLNFLVCLGGIAVFYRLAAQRFSSWRVGLLGAILLVLSPRLFADYFYNMKDVIFMTFFTGAVATAVPFIRRPSWRAALWHALSCALAIDMRVMGLLVPAATLAFVGLQVVQGSCIFRRAAAFTGIYLALLAGLVVVFWPYLWAAPVSNFTAALRAMSHYPWLGNVLYQGRLMAASAIPWHYPLVWIGLTVPLGYLAWGGVGTAGLLRRLVRVRLPIQEADWQDLLFLGLGLAPLVAVVALHSVLYNGWRHLYFVYPMLLLLALRGMVSAWHWRVFGRWQRYWQPALGLAIGSMLAVVGGRMARLHPLENLYFNALAPKPVGNYYETDYWSMGLIQGLEWLVEHDSRPRICLSSNLLASVAVSQLLLPAEARQRLVLVTDPTQADYYLDSTCYPHAAPYSRPCYTLWAEDVWVLSLYRLPPTPPTPTPRAASRASE